MQDNLKKNIQKERFAKALIEIRQDVTEDDRKEAVKETGLSQSCIVIYLKGKVSSSDIAAKLLSIFRKRIAEREKVLQSA